jgi:hypothetical protein
MFLFQFLISTSWWFLLLCAGVAFAGTYVLYYFSTDDAQTPLLKKILSALRFVVLFGIAFYLLQPLIKTLQRTIQKPIVVVVQDNSASLLKYTDSNYVRTVYPTKINELINALSAKYDVKTMSFGATTTDDLSLNFTQKRTNISNALKDIDTKYSGLNVGAVVLASDGNYNAGANPLQQAGVIKAPFYTVLMGDTLPKVDVAVTNVTHNSTVYLGNNFPLQAQLNALQLQGSSATVTVTSNGVTVAQQALNVASNDYYTSINLLAKATKVGKQAFDVVVKSSKKETNTANNRFTFYVDVIDSRQKILLLAAQPHPDVAALQQALSSNEAYEVTVKTADKFDYNFNPYNLVVLHQLPSATFTNMDGLVKGIAASTTSLLYVIGAQTQMNNFAQLNSGVSLLQNRNLVQETEPVYNTDFAQFTLDASTKEELQTWPPLNAFFGTYQVNADMNVLIKQAINNVTTNYPLIAVGQSQGKKTGVIVGEGLWRWRMANYKTKENTIAFDEIINKIVQFLAVKEQKENFKVICPQLFFEGDAIIIDAELYNNVFELINDNEVSLQVTDAAQKKYNYTFSKNDKSYTANIGQYAPGNYNYVASAMYNNKPYTRKGSFTVATINAEDNVINANTTLMRQLATQSGGRMYTAQTTDALKELLINQKELPSVSYSERTIDDFINYKWPCLLLILLLAIEWFVRKRNGLY